MSYVLSRHIIMLMCHLLTSWKLQYFTKRVWFYRATLC